MQRVNACVLALLLAVAPSIAHAYAIKGEDVRLNTATFGENLAITDNDLQKMAQKFNDFTFAGAINWDEMPLIQPDDINWDSVDESMLTAINWTAYLGGADVNWYSVPSYETDPVWTGEKASYATTASLSWYVPTSRTVNGQALTGNVTISTVSGNAGTASALAANGGNCTSGQAALGVDASGAAEGCWTPSDTKWDGGNVGINTTTARATLGLGSAALANTGDFLASGGTAANSSQLEGHAANYFQPAGTYMTGATANGGLSVSSTTLGLTPCTGNEGYIMKWNAATGWTCQADQSAASGLATTDIDTSSELDAIVTDDTGSGALVFATSPTIVTPTIAKLANLTTNGIVRTSGGDGTLGVDTTVYLSGVSVNSPLSGAGTPASPLAVDLSSKQASDAGLTSLAGLTYTSPAFVRMTGEDTFTLDTAIYLLPTGSAAQLTNFPTLNQNTTGTAAGLTAQYIDWNSVSGGNSIANKPTISGSNTGDSAANSTYSGLDFLVGTATAALSGEIVMGTSPGGELGGTWASPTIDDGITVANMVLTTPNIGVSTATSINKVTITAPASSATLTIADGKTLTATNTVNLNTMTNARLCQYKTTGTVIDCDVDPATYQPALSSASNIGIGTGTVAANLIVSGNLGVGTTIPSARLNVIGVNTTSASMAVNVRNSAMTTMFTILDNGNVGVGTIAPSGLFEVKSASGTNYFPTNVGIGTTVPRKQLDVAGAIQLDGAIYLKSPDGSWGYCTLANDNTFGCIGL